ncbi:MAG: S-layer homology domain-containing protein [Oscillospiraceae bacterium]
MRTLKKTLCLVLVLAMVLSCGIMASADFPDADEIVNVEAVDVLVALGIITGDEAADGTISFNPTGTLTRAQAACILVRMLGAEDIATGTAPFTDMEGYDWAEGAIAYCANEGIVNGIGDGLFDPAGELTGYAWAKMLLGALGYDAKVEKMTGEGWEIAVAKLAKSVELFGTDTSDKTAPVSRDAACAWAFNALDVDMVYYESTGSDVTIGDIEISANKTRKSAGVTIAELLGLECEDNYVPADGMTYHYWTINGKVATDLYLDDTYVASFPAGTTYAAMAKAVGITKNNTKTAGWYANGDLKSSLTAADVIACLTDTTEIEAPVDVYKDAAGDYKIMATYTYLAEVTDVTKLTGLDAGLDEVEFTVYDDTPTGYTVTFDETAEIATGTYAEGDLFLVVPVGDTSAADDFLAISTPETIQGKVTGTGTGYIRVDGVKYATDPCIKQLDDALDYNTSTFTFYLNAYDEIIGYSKNSTTPPAASFDGVLYLTGAQYQMVGADSSLYGDVAYSASAKASVYFAGEAASKVIDLAVYTKYNADGTVDKTYIGDDVSAWEMTVDTGVVTNAGISTGFYCYNETEDGYVLTAVTNPGACVVTLKANKADVITDKYADSKTVVTVYNYDSTAKAVTKTEYTGIAGYPATATGKVYNTAEATVDAIVVSYVKNSSGVDTALVKSIDIYTTEATPAATTPVNYARFVGEGEQYDTGKYFQGFYVGGEYVEYKKASSFSDTLNAGKLYDVTLNDKGEISAVSEISVTSGAVSYVGSTYVIIDGGAPIYLTNDVAVYNVSTGHAGEADTIAVGDTVEYAVVASGDDAGKIAVIYITVEG